MMMRRRNKNILYLATEYKNFLTQKELQIKKSSLLNVSNGSSRPEEKNNVISIIAKKSISIYLYVYHIVIEGIRPGYC